MFAQLTFLPSESKKFIAKALMVSDLVKRAARDGTIAIHPSSSTYFVTQELLGHKPPTGVWVGGVVIPKGACGEMGSASGHAGQTEQDREKIASPDLTGFKHTYVIHKGKFSIGIPLGEILDGMGPKDIYVKGVNALDPQGKVAVLIGGPSEKGTISLALSASRRRGFTILCPVGLEKLIPIPVAEAAKVANRNRYNYSMGLPCSLIPCDGEHVQVVTELKAVEMLGGATAVPIAAGGLSGAEGSVTLIVQGKEEQVTNVIKVAESCKGAQLPAVRVNSCFDCRRSWCRFPVGDKPWVVM